MRASNCSRCEMACPYGSAVDLTSFIRVDRQTGRVVPGPFRVSFDPERCDQCGGGVVASVQGRWGEWQLYEARCPNNHYWAVDLITKQRVVAFGYRMDRYTGERKAGVPACVTEKWNCRPDEKGSPLTETDLAGGGTRFLPDSELPF